MKRNHYGKTGSRSEAPKEISRREFFKLGGAGLATGVAFASGAGTLLFSNTAYARRREVQGRSLEVVQLDRPLSELDHETETRYQRREHQPNDSNDHTYQSIAIVPETVSVLVTLNERRDQKDVSVSASSLPRAVGTAINDFAQLVQRVTNAPLRRVKIILERGTFELEGRQVDYTNAYILPINQEGQITTHLGNGEYLIYGVTQYERTVTSDPFVLAEPNRQASLNVSIM